MPARLGRNRPGTGAELFHGARVKANTNAMARVIQFEQDGFTLIYELAAQGAS
jgi:hypothetical protein